MARIIVDGGGSWTSPSGKFLRSGVHETNDPILIEEALNEPLDWVDVVDDEADAAAAAVREERKRALLSGLEPEVQDKAEAPPVTQQLVDTSSESTDPSLNTTGPMTSADLERTEWNCNLCDFGAKSQAGLQSHRRNRHPEVDPTSGLPIETVEPITDQSVEHRDTSPVATGPVQGT